MPLTPYLERRLADPDALSHIECHRFTVQPLVDSVFKVLDPATHELLALLPDMGLAETKMTIARAHTAQHHWGELTAATRSKLLRLWQQSILNHSEDLAAILTAECGKPLAEARAEIEHCINYMAGFAEEAVRIGGEIIPSPSHDRRLMVVHHPAGIVGAITTWNFPASLMVRKVGAALAAGCCVILKPSERAPLTVGAMFALAQAVGFPAGVLNIIYASRGDIVSRELCRNTNVRRLSFTGSSRVGRILLRSCAGNVKKMTLELGGMAPFIVFADADVDAAVSGAIQAKFRNSGQTCVAANTFYVDAEVHDEFLHKLTARVSSLVVGNGYSPGVEIGPIVGTAAVERLEALVGDATQKGARLECGGRRLVGSYPFFEPTVVSQVSPRMQLARSEIFGPIAPVIKIGDAQKTLQHVNSTEFGLAAYFYTSNPSRIWRWAEALEFGMVAVNTGRMSSEAAPFGGIKQSGLGREGSRYGLGEFLDTKYLCLAGIQG